MTAPAAQGFEQITPSPPPGAVPVVGNHGGEGPFLPARPFVPYRLIEVLAEAGLEPAETLATLVMLPLAKEDPQAPGLWVLPWSQDACARLSKTSVPTVQRAKRKLKAAGLITRITRPAKGDAADWDVTRLICTKPTKKGT